MADEAPRPSNPALPPSNGISRRPSAPSPFGTLNVPGNALVVGRAQSSGNAHSHHGNNHNHGNHAGNQRGFNAIREEDDDAGPLSRSNPPGSSSGSGAGGGIAGGPLGFLGPPPSALGRRVSVSGESISPSLTPSSRPPPFFPKTPEQLARLEEAISDAFLFRKLDARKRKAVLGAMKEVRFEREGEVVIKQGDDGDFFYVVDSGTLDCFVKSPDDPVPASSTPSVSSPLSPATPTAAGAGGALKVGDYHPVYGKKVTSYGRGGTFGELALMYFAKRAATIVTTSPSSSSSSKPTEPTILWALDRLTFQTTLLDISAATRRSYESFLSSVPLLDSLTSGERARLADCLTGREYGAGEVVIREGEVGREFFMLEEGGAEVVKGGKVVKVLGRGDYFGGQWIFLAVYCWFLFFGG